MERYRGPTRLYALVRERKWQGIPLNLRLHMIRGEKCASCEAIDYEFINGENVPRRYHFRPGESLNIKGHIFLVEKPIEWNRFSGKITFNRCWNAADEDVLPFKVVRKPLYLFPFYAAFRLAYESFPGQYTVNTLARFTNGVGRRLLRLHEQLDEDSNLALFVKSLIELSIIARDKLCENSFEVR